jgi:hypothetical protein
MPCNYLLVGCDNRFARFERPADPRAGRFKASDEFNYDVSVRRENIVNVVGPLNVRRNPVRALALKVPIENVCDAQPRRMLGKYSRD